MAVDATASAGPCPVRRCAPEPLGRHLGRCFGRFIHHGYDK